MWEQKEPYSPDRTKSPTEGLITAVLTNEIEQTTEFANGLRKLHQQGDWG